MEEDVKTSHHCVILMLLIAWFTKHSENLFNWHILQESVTDLVRSNKTVIPIDWLWLMDDSGLLSITKYLFYPHTQQENNKLNEFSKQVINIFSYGNPKEEHIKMLQSDIVIWLVSSGFPSQKMEISIKRDYCKLVIFNITLISITEIQKDSYPKLDIIILYNLLCYRWTPNHNNYPKSTSSFIGTPSHPRWWWWWCWWRTISCIIRG